MSSGGFDGSEPFYMPSPGMFGHADAYSMFTNYAARLEKAGLANRFPPEPDLRNIAIELLAERYATEDVRDDPDEYIPDAIAEAKLILEERTNL